MYLGDKVNVTDLMCDKDLVRGDGLVRKMDPVCRDDLVQEEDLVCMGQDLKDLVCEDDLVQEKDLVTGYL